MLGSEKEQDIYVSFMCVGWSLNIWGVGWEDGVVLGKQGGQKSDHDWGRLSSYEHEG